MHYLLSQIKSLPRPIRVQLIITIGLVICISGYGFFLDKSQSKVQQMVLNNSKLQQSLELKKSYLNHNQDVTLTIQDLQQQLESYQKNLASSFDATNFLHDLGIIAGQAGVTLLKIAPQQITLENKTKIAAYQILLQGAYAKQLELVKLLYHLPYALVVRKFNLAPVTKNKTRTELNMELLVLDAQSFLLGLAKGQPLLTKLSPANVLANNYSELDPFAKVRSGVFAAPPKLDTWSIQQLTFVGSITKANASNTTWAILVSADGDVYHVQVGDVIALEKLQVRSIDHNTLSVGSYDLPLLND